VEVVAGFDPERLDLRKLAKNSTVEKVAKVIGKDLNKLKISDVQSTKPESVKAELIEEDGKQAVKVTVTTTDKAERISARVTAKTNLEQPKELQLYVYGQVTEDLVVNRTYVLFPRANNGTGENILASATSILAAPLLDKGMAVNLKVTSLSEKPFKIEGISDPEGAVVGYAEPEENGWKVVLLLAGKPKTSRGKISLKTNRSDQPTIDVRYGVRSMARANRRPGPPGGKGMPPMRLNPGQRLTKDKHQLKLAPRLQKPPPHQGKLRPGPKNAMKARPGPRIVPHKIKKPVPTEPK